jgi:hypothetical protein
LTFPADSRTLNLAKSDCCTQSLPQ